MRAAVHVGIEDPMSVEEVELLAPGPRDVVVRVTASGVCHSDLSIRRGVVPSPPPIVLGHEGAGVVEAVGAEVTRTRVGDRVIASFVPACGRCWWCLHDESNLCDYGAVVGRTPRIARPDGSRAACMTGLGTFAEMMTVDEASVVPIDTDLPDEQLALIGCGVTTGVGAALNTAAVEPGASVAVIGCGGVGQSVVQGARIAGAAQIIAIDPVELKRETAQGFGATHVVDPGEGDAVAQVKDLTGGRGVDYAFEVIGRSQFVEQAYAMARRGGTAVAVGMPPPGDTVSVPNFSLFRDEKKLVGSFYGGAQVLRDFERLVRLAEAGRLDLAGMVSRRIALDDVDAAFLAMEAGEVIRSVISFPS